MATREVVPTATPVLTSVTFGSGSALSVYTDWQSFTATITSSNGGDAIPTYGAASIARYMRIANIVFYEVYLANTSGGTAGSGTGQLRMTLPLTAATNSVSYLSVNYCGSYVNSTSQFMLFNRIQSGATFMDFNKLTIATGVYADFTPNDQNNANRNIFVKGFYECAP